MSRPSQDPVGVLGSRFLTWKHGKGGDSGDRGGDRGGREWLPSFCLHWALCLVPRGASHLDCGMDVEKWRNPSPRSTS